MYIKPWWEGHNQSNRVNTVKSYHCDDTYGAQWFNLLVAGSFPPVGGK